MKFDYKLTPQERETIILFSDDGNDCTIYTCNRKMITKMDKLCKLFPKSHRLISKDEVSKTYLTDKRLISIRTETKKREVSDEQKKALSERAKKNLKR